MKTTSHVGARKVCVSVWVSKGRLPLELAVRGRRAILLNIPGTAQKYDVRLPEKYRECRLKIHPDKTKILSNQGLKKRKEVTIDNIKVEVMTVKECAKYLGQTKTFEQQETTEIKSRIRAAWPSFTMCR